MSLGSGVGRGPFAPRRLKGKPILPIFVKEKTCARKGGLTTKQVCCKKRGLSFSSFPTHRPDPHGSWPCSGVHNCLDSLEPWLSQFSATRDEQLHSARRPPGHYQYLGLRRP